MIRDSTPPASATTLVHGPWILAATILGSSLSFIDGTVVNVALPTLQRDLHASAADAQWVIEAYALFLSALILVGGALGDRLGRRRTYAAGIVIFTVASIGCGLAGSVAVLVAARVLQGIGGALLVPGSLAIISALFQGAARGRAIGSWSGFTTVTSALGPVLGGWLVQNASWRWVFFINVPLALLTLALLYWRVPESRDEAAHGAPDWLGALLATVGLGAVVYALIEAGSAGFARVAIVAPLLLGCLFLALFVVVEGRIAAPMMPLTVFRSRTFSGANLLTLLLYGALGGALYYLPFDLQQVQGYGPAAAGAALLPFTLIVFALSRWSGGLVARYGARLPLIIGPLIVAVGFVLFALPAQGGSYWTTFFPAIIALSLGMALVIAPLSTTVMGAVEQSRSGVASGVNNAVSRAAGLLAIATLGLVVSGLFTAGLDRRLTALAPPAAVRAAMEAQRGRLAAAQPPPQADRATRTALTSAVAASFIDGFRAAMLASAGLALASAVSAAVLIEGRGRPTTPQAR